MDILEVRYKLVTPLFMGGADPNGRAELRPPSIKGALRFWYRALDPQYSSKNEAHVFGGIGKGEGLSSFLIRLQDVRMKVAPAQDARWDGSPIAYLAFGPVARDRELKKSVTMRPYFDAGSTFTLRVVFRRDTRREDRLAIERALWAMGVFGGLGSRARKGFGSLTATHVEGSISGLPWSFDDPASLVQVLKRFLGESCSVSEAYPEHTSWSKHSRCVVSQTFRNGQAALEWLGREMHRYRSYKGDKLFVDDHDLMLDYLRTGRIQRIPRRVAFGLPHNYYFASLRVAGEVNLTCKEAGGAKGRRASPLFFHVQELTNGQVCVVATFMPARFIPTGCTITVSGNGQKPWHHSAGHPFDFSAVNGFMDRLVKSGARVVF